MAAHDATLSEALAQLRGPSARAADDILHNRAVLWIGSGVSRTRLPALEFLLKRLLQELYNAQDPSNPACPYRVVIREIIHLTTFRGDREIDAARPPGSWPAGKYEKLVEELISQYADVMGIPLQVVGRNSLAWDFLKLQQVYGDGAIEPDAEHFFIALLLAEGAVSNVITANWDPLIERAFGMLGCGPELHVVACPQDLADDGGGAHIIKIHGCAKRMLLDEARYRPYMVITRDDINSWAGRPESKPIGEQVRVVLRAHPGVFVGLSGQDFNIQAQFIQAAIGGVEYPIDPPRITFAEPAIGGSQRAILQAFYRGQYASNAETVNQRALLPLFAKPLFGTLYVMLIVDKLQCLLRKCGDQFPFVELQTFARDGIQRIEVLIAARYDALPDPDVRWRALAAEVPRCISRMLCIFRRHNVPAGTEIYEPIHIHHSEFMDEDPNLCSAKLHWLLLATILFAEGDRLGLWNLQLSILPSGEDGQLRATIRGSEEVVVFLIDSDIMQQRLMNNGLLKPGSNRRVMIVYPGGVEPARIRRSPARTLPHAGASRGPIELWFAETATQVTNVREFLDVIRSALLTAERI